MKKNYNAAYHLGVRAKNNGWDRSSNPYKNLNTEAFWLAGFNDEPYNEKEILINFALSKVSIRAQKL